MNPAKGSGPGVYIGREKTGKIVFVCRAYMAHLGAQYLCRMADKAGVVLTEINHFKRKKP